MAIELVKVPCPICGQNSNKIVAVGYDFEYLTTEKEFNFCKCNKCELLYLSPRPGIKEINRIYPPEYNAFHFHKIKNPIVRWGRSFIQKRKVIAIKKLLPGKADVIDVGCGSGTLLKILKKYGRREWNLSGNDFNDNMLQLVRKNNIRTISGRFENIDNDIKYDLIIFNQAIEHLDYPSAVIKKSNELLKERGFLFIFEDAKFIM